jgi:hypothetical protein
MIRKISNGYRVVARSGRNMGTYRTREEAEKRLREVEFFKHRKLRSPRHEKRNVMAHKAVGKIHRKPGKGYYVTAAGTVMEMPFEGNKRKSAHSWKDQPRRHSKAAKKGVRRKRAK